MFFPLVIFVYSLLLRFPFLNRAPFWVDEFSTASQAVQIMQHGLSFFSPGYHPELNNILPHLIVALCFRLFGVSEMSARIFMVIIGAGIPVAIYLLVNRHISRSVALSTAFLTCCSYFLITWSRQARGYSLQALLTIAILAVYLMMQKEPHTKRTLPLFIVLGILGLLTHSAFVLVLLALCIDQTYVIVKHGALKRAANTTGVIISAFILVAVSSVLFGYLTTVNTAIISQLLHTNNLWYYHSFLWREYGLISFLGFSGLILLHRKHSSLIRPVLLIILIQLVFVCFIWPPYTSRYLLTLFPFLMLGTAASIQALVKHPIGTILVTLIIIGNGDKFVLKPKQYYSLNHDFREISNIDYNEIYQHINRHGKISEGKTAIIDTWHDRLYWYMGQNYTGAYLFRWIDGRDRINGLPQHTTIAYNSRGEKIIPDRPSLRFVGELSDLKRAMKRYPRGFLLIDDATLPKDVLSYADKHLRKELYLDHYSLDDNPYSIWPTTLYSWGFGK